MVGLNMFARSVRLLSVRRAILQSRRMVRRIAFAALSLTAGEKLVKSCPSRLRARRGRKVYPRKSKLIKGYRPLRLESRQ